MDGQPCVACVGGANVDIVGTAAGPLDAGDSTPGTIQMLSGGVGRNVAENLVRLGVHARLVTVLGGDANGDRLFDAATAAGVDMQHAIRIQDGTTPAYLSIYSPDGELQLAINDMQLLDRLGPEAIAGLGALFAGADAVVADANLRSDTLQRLAGSTGETPLYIDAVSAAKSPRLAGILSSIDTLKTTRAEAAALMDAREPDLEVIGRWFSERGVRNLFVTLGDRGVYYRTEGGEGTRTPSRPGGRIIRSGGAGDAFLAGLVYSRLSGLPLDGTIDFALACAQLVVGQTENVPAVLSPENVEALL